MARFSLGCSSCPSNSGPIFRYKPNRRGLNPRCYGRTAGPSGLGHVSTCPGKSRHAPPSTASGEPARPVSGFVHHSVRSIQGNRDQRRQTCRPTQCLDNAWQAFGKGHSLNDKVRRFEPPLGIAIAPDPNPVPRASGCRIRGGKKCVCKRL